jgi:hypothetical protein
MKINVTELSAAAQAQLAAYKQTGAINCTQELYNEAYELLANGMDPRTRQDVDRQYSYVMRCINQLL